MKNGVMKKRYYFLGFLTIVGILLILLCVKVERLKDFPVMIEISMGESVETIKPVYDKSADMIYIVLPSYASVDNIKVVSDRGYSVDGIVFDEVWLLGHANDGNTYAVSREKFWRRGKCCTVQIFKTQGIGSVYANTVEGIDRVLDNKDYKEPISLTTISCDGLVDYSGADFIIKGHGNSTWRKEKRPFTIRADKAISLLGMGESYEWVLLANSFDTCSLRNWLVYSISSEAGMELVTGIEYVDLFIDGEYKGLYQLAKTPKGLFSAAKANESAVLFSAERSDRITEESDCIRLKGKNYAEVRASVGEDSELNDVAKSKLAAADLVVMSEDDIEGVFLSSAIDVKAWAIRYLLDEIFENFDAGVTSSYFYVYGDSQGDTVVYPGPIWDYDNSIGNLDARYGTTNDPTILYAANGLKTDYGPIMWYKELYNKTSFRREVVEEYISVLRPLVEKYAEGIILDKAKEIELSASISSHVLGEDLNMSESAYYICDYLRERLRFLDDIWVEETCYKKIIIDGMNNEIDIYYLKEGESLSDNAFFNERFSGGALHVKGSGELFDVSTVIREDLYLTYDYKGERSFKESLHEKYYYNKGIIWCIPFLMLFSGFALTLFLKDLKNNSNKEKKVRAKNGR